MYRYSRKTFFNLLNHTINFAVDFIDSDIVTRVGDQSNAESKFVVKINDPGFYKSVLTYGNLGIGESFMSNGFEMIRGSLEDFITSLLSCRLDHFLYENSGLKLKLIPFRVAGFLRGQKRSVRSHYDMDLEIFKAFLDPSLTYSCGYAIHENDSLAQLQFNKYDRICKKLMLSPNEKLLDIGCGYAGMLIHAATYYGVYGTGVTNSLNHYEVGKKTIHQLGLSDKITIQLNDYKKVTGSFDKIVSIGMIEHLSRNQYPIYFSTINKALSEHGRGLVHGVGANSHKNVHDYFIQKYIFPMSNQPRLSEIAGHLEKNGLAIVDVENMIRHYGYTATHWLNNFISNRHLILRSDTFKRMIEYYLICCIAAAKASDAALYQVLFMKNHSDAIPLKRV